MKKLEKISALIFSVLSLFGLVLPMLFFNTEKNAVSDIDNKELISADEVDFGDATEVSELLSDRIGFRSQAISAYINLNDTLFYQMEHPLYCYGQDDYVFFKVTEEKVDTDFIASFCAYLKRIQSFCEERDVPFVYFINPSKTTVYSQYLPRGYRYTNEFLSTLYKELDKNGINWFSTVEMLTEKAQTEQVFNVQYDAGHWNDLGEFYATNMLLNKLSQYFPAVKQHQLSDFTVTTEWQTSLLVSQFQINEEVPLYTLKDSAAVEELAGYEDLKSDKTYHNNRVYRLTCAQSDLPDVLFFHGSYYNHNRDFYKSSFNETYVVHNYQNILDFEYYYNIFQPDCVILETAEYATNATYFNAYKLKSTQFTQAFSSLILKNHTEIALTNRANPTFVTTDDKGETGTPVSISQYKIQTTSDSHLATVSFVTDKTCLAAYLVSDGTYCSCFVQGNTFTCTYDKTKFNISRATLYLWTE